MSKVEPRSSDSQNRRWGFYLETLHLDKGQDPSTNQEKDTLITRRTSSDIPIRICQISEENCTECRDRFSFDYDIREGYLISGSRGHSLKSSEPTVLYEGI